MIDGEFEWDDAKATLNLVKHGVAFEAGCRAFSDAFAIEIVDSESQPGELRYRIIASVQGVLLTVVYTERGARIRIISARKATKHEQREYYRSQRAE
ncbi:MAG: BrnT family toxin [Acidobacteria bacterium]|nr:BrnT family toxin [Acidobacteriota bacterium]